MEQINVVVVKAGHQFVKKEEDLKGDYDSFVVETDVHYPTDINLLFDAIGYVIQQQNNDKIPVFMVQKA